MFRYPCSYLIDSEAFRALPVRLRTRVREKLQDILSTTAPLADYPSLTPENRREILAILRDTHPDWQDGGN